MICANVYNECLFENTVVRTSHALDDGRKTRFFSCRGFLLCDLLFCEASKSLAKKGCTSLSHFEVLGQA